MTRIMTHTDFALAIVLAVGCGACGQPTQTAPVVLASQGASQAAPVDQAAKPAPAARQGRWMVDAKALTLSQLAESAERIFVGTIKAVETKSVTLTESGRSIEGEVRDVSIAIDEGIKGVAGGQLITVRQLVSASASVAVGEQVMWFLPPPSHLGLSQPLGVFSGDFRIEVTPAGNRVVQNLRGNAGLWSGSVWDEGFNRDQVLLAARSRDLPQARVQAMEVAAARDPAEQGVPLDLLLFLTRNVVKQ
jgi:hypothetical protein